MGAVHGVYLKYVGLSAASYAGYAYLAASGDSAEQLDFSGGFRDLLTTGYTNGALLSHFRLGITAILGYSAILNGTIALLFKIERGMGLIGKDPGRGQLPMWSYLAFFPFHLPTMLYTFVHTKMGSHGNVPVASEVQPGWWVGGCYAYELNKHWGGIIDLTVEFPERCINRCDSYLLVATWDGVPATPAQLEEAALFAVEARKKGDVLVHCAHGRGRSTTVMCAALVKAGLYSTWEEAFSKGIKPGRPVCKLNSKMRTALTKWQATYIDNKKVA